MKVKVKKEFKQLKEIFPINFITEITPVLTNKEIHEQVYNRKAKRIEIVITKPIGSYESCIIIGVNGEKYSDSTIRNFISYVPLNEIFEKI